MAINLAQTDEQIAKDLGINPDTVWKDYGLSLQQKLSSTLNIPFAQYGLKKLQAALSQGAKLSDSYLVLAGGDEGSPAYWTQDFILPDGTRLQQGSLGVRGIVDRGNGSYQIMTARPDGGDGDLLIDINPTKTGSFTLDPKSALIDTGESSGLGGFVDKYGTGAALAYMTGGLGAELGAATGMGTAGGTAALQAGLGAAQGQDLEQIATNAAIGGAASGIGSSVGSELGKTTGQLTAGTTAGLLRGQDLGTALTGAAVNTGASLAAGGLLSAGTTPASTISPNYGLTEGQNIGGLGLTVTPAQLDMSNPYSFDTTTANTGGLGFNANLAGLDTSNLYTLNSNFGNLDSMGGGTGIQVPLQEGATLGSIGAEAEASSSSNTNQNLLGKLISSALIGSTGTGNNMATTPSNTAALGSLLGGLLGGAGSLMQGSTNVEARQKMADELRAAGQQAAQASQFRPVGTTTRFGSSNFQVDPTTGQLTSAGYTATPLAQGYQDQLAGMTSQGLLQGQQIQGLANQYLGESPEAVRQRYVEQQNALLAPGNEQALAGIRNNLFQTGRTGLATGATSAGDLAATNPEMAAYYNSLANQQRQIAAGADTAAQNQIKFGQQLGAAAYDPFAAGFGAQAAVEKQAMMPLGLSTDLAAQFQKANAAGGVLNLEAQKAASQAMFPANQYNPYASLLSGASGSNQLTSALGGLFGQTGVGSALGNWLGSLGVGQDWTGSPGGLDTSNIDYNYLSQIYSGGNPYAGTTWDGE